MGDMTTWSLEGLLAEIDDAREARVHHSAHLDDAVLALNEQVGLTAIVYGPASHPASSEHAIRELRGKVSRLDDAIDGTNEYMVDLEAELARRADEALNVAAEAVAWSERAATSTIRPSWVPVSTYEELAAAAAVLAAVAGR